MNTPCTLSSILRNGRERAFSALQEQRCPYPRGTEMSSPRGDRGDPHPAGTQMSLTLRGQRWPSALFLGETRQNWGWNTHGTDLGWHFFIAGERQEGTVTTATHVHTGPGRGQRAGASAISLCDSDSFPSFTQGQKRPCLSPGAIQQQMANDCAMTAPTVMGTLWARQKSGFSWLCCLHGLS